ALDKLHRDEGEIALMEIFVNLDDVVVGKLCDGLRLAAESRHDLGRLEDGLAWDFKGDISPQVDLAGAVDLAHAADAQDLLDLIFSGDDITGIKVVHYSPKASLASLVLPFHPGPQADKNRLSGRYATT